MVTFLMIHENESLTFRTLEKRKKSALNNKEALIFGAIAKSK